MNIVTKPEFRDLIPPLSEDESRQLEENIVRDGCREPIVLWKPLSAQKWNEAIIIDGHNRHRICTAHDIPFEITEKEFEDEDAAKVWIILTQKGRRNLDKSQLAMLAAELEKVYAVQAKKRMAQAEGMPRGVKASAVPNLAQEKETGRAVEQAAKDMGVGKSTVQMAKAVEESCIPRISNMVKKGDLSVSAAEKVSTLSIQEQSQLADKGAKAIVEKASEIRTGGKVVQKQRFSKWTEETELWLLTPVNFKAKAKMKKPKQMTSHEMHLFIEEIDHD